MRGTLIELLREKYFLLEPGFFTGARNRVLSDPTGASFAPQSKDGSVQGIIRFRSGSAVDSFNSGKIWMSKDEVSKAFGYAEDYNDDDFDDDDDEYSNEQMINVVRLTSPMTRGGGECSYGSLEIRDAIMEAAKKKKCVGHIIYCRTPGGAASTLRDFRMAIDYAHSKGQKVYMFCDGDVASGGAFLSAMCDGVYFMNPDDEIGSIGMYSAFFTMKDGAKNSITDEDYHEYYCTKSPEKNKWYRDAANGDMETVAKETEEFLDELLADLKADRPSIIDEQMKGAMYKMRDVVGSLVDGQSTMDELAQMIYNEWYSRNNNASATAGDRQSNNNQKNIMSKQYIQISAFIGNPVALECDKDGGVYLQAHEADALEAKIPTVAGREMELAKQVMELKAQLSDAQKLAETVTAERDGLKQQVDELQKQLEGAVPGDDVSALKQELEGAKASLATAETENASLKEQLNTVNGELEESRQAVEDLNAKVAAYEAGPGKGQGQGEAPKTNGMQPKTPHLEAAPVWNDALSVAENRKRFEEYKKKLQVQASQM